MINLSPRRHAHCAQFHRRLPGAGRSRRFAPVALGCFGGLPGAVRVELYSATVLEFDNKVADHACRVGGSGTVHSGHRQEICARLEQPRAVHHVGV